MLLFETAIFWLVIGAGVAAAACLRDCRGSLRERVFLTITAVLFWPLYFPVLLSGSEALPSDESDPLRPEPPPPRDELAASITQVESELDAALSSLDGWAENVLAAEQSRLEELRTAWRAQAARIRQLDVLLAQPEPQADPLAGAAAEDERVRHCEEVRRENLGRLRTLRSQMYADLIGTLAWVRELVTMIHLAKFTGAPATRAGELVTQIAAAVEGLSEVSSWKEDEDVPISAHA